MDPEKAQEQYRRPDNPQRHHLERDVQAFLDAGGQIQHLDGHETSYDAAAKGVPYERKNRQGGINGRQVEKDDRYEWQIVLDVVTAKPGLTRGELAQKTGFTRDRIGVLAATLSSQMQRIKHGPKRTCSVSGQVVNTWYPKQGRT